MAKKTLFFPYKPEVTIFILPFTGPAWYSPHIPNFAYFFIKSNSCSNFQMPCLEQTPSLNCSSDCGVSVKISIVRVKPQLWPAHALPLSLPGDLQQAGILEQHLLALVKSCQTRETPLCEPVKYISWVAVIAKEPISPWGTITPTVSVAVFPTLQVHIPKPATQSST